MTDTESGDAQSVVGRIFNVICVVANEATAKLKEV